TMTKVIKVEFKKLESLKIGDDSFACNTSEWMMICLPMRLKFLDLLTFHDRGDDEVELSEEESFDSDDEDKVAEIFRMDTNVFDFETPMCRAFNEFNYLLQIDPDVLTKNIEGFKTYKDYKDYWIYEWNEDVPWVYERPWMDNGVWEEPTPVRHHCEPFNYKNGFSKWPTCSWKDDRYCNGGNLHGAYIVGNTLRYQDLEWYKALKIGKLKDEALKNKDIIEGMIDDDDESHNNGWKRWDEYENAIHDHEEERMKKNIEMMKDANYLITLAKKLQF
ncbi:hypothetical protein Tco_1478110, partial [Tanacetum coccineum]